ncbi:hypothetical protein LPJGGPFB_04804 [Ensifer adhaerens]|uniref:YihY/virulence factor BrkB family protein n=1 Tax=Ensifer adhaerens TaxID=106592 RepID=UPI0015697D75|nr:YihY/virulence factor BrkB family protein [Ensifer adhaerens]NRP21545.1 hypothetical protein [Ensifer adhaerens]
MSEKRGSIDPASALAIVAISMIVGDLLCSKHLRSTSSEISAFTPTRAQGDEKRGRTASVPEKLPARGLRDVFWRVVNEIKEDRIAFVAAAVTFYLVLALFPALAALVSLYGLVADAGMISEHLEDLAVILPPGAFEIFADQLQALIVRRDATLGFALVVGLAIAFWSTRNGVLAIFEAMNVAYEEKEKRGFFKLNCVALGFSVCAVFAAVFMIGVVAWIPTFLQSVWLDPWKESLVLVARWPTLLLVSFIAIISIYRFGPSRHPAKLRWLTWGAAIATVGWAMMTLGFSWYLENYANYDATYGALGSLVGFLMWIWLSVIILVVGAEVNAELEHQTARDTTTGAPRPMGERGAQMADTIGEIPR